MAQAKSDAGKRIAIVVAGMHRSGTSSLTKILSAYGFKLPKTLLEANNSNEAGFWESVAINRLNDKIFQTFDANWRSWQPLPVDWPQASDLSALRKEALDTLLGEFDSAPSILLKDPRFSRLMPFWLPVLEEFGMHPVVVCPIRNPLESAVSLQQRNSVPQALGLLIWLRYQLEVEYDTRGRPRSFTHYNALLTDWRKVIDKVSIETGCTLPQIPSETEELLGAWLSPKLRHHMFPDAAILHDAAYPEWVRSAYAIFLRWTQIQEDENDFKYLDRIRNELNGIPDSLKGILDIGQANIDDARRLRKKLESQETQLTEISRQQAKKDASAKFFEEQFTQAKLNVERTMQRLAELDTAASVANDRLRDSKSELESANQRNIELAKQLSQSEINLAAIKSRQTDSEDRSRRFEQQYETMLRQLAQLQAEGNLFAERTKERDKAFETLDQVSKELRQQLTVREATMVERERRLEELNSTTKELRRLLAAQESAIAARDQKIALFEQRHEEHLHRLAQLGAEASLYAERTKQYEREYEALLDASKSLRQQLEGREGVIAERDRNLELLKQQQLETFQRLAQLGAEASLSTERNAQLERKLENLRNVSEDLRQQLQIREAVIAAHTEEFELIKQQQAEKLAQLKQVEAEAKHFAEKASVQERDLKELNSRLSEMQQQLVERNATIVETDKKSAFVEQQRDKALQNLAEKETEAKLITERYLAVEQSLEDLSDSSRELEQQLAKLQAAITERESAIEEIKQQRDEALNQLAQKENEARLYNERYIERQRALEELGDILSELQRQLAERDVVIVEREHELAQTVQQRDESLLQLMELAEEVKNSAEQIVDLQKLIETHNLLSTDLQQQLLGYETALAERDTRLSEAEQQRMEMLQQLAKKEEETWLYSELYEEQKQSVETLSFASNELEQRIAKHEATIAERDNEVTQVQQQLEQLMIQLSKKEAETQLHSIKAAEQEQLLESLNAHSSEIERKLAIQSGISADLGQTISQIENQRNELLQHLETNKAESKRLSVQLTEQEQTIEELNNGNQKLTSRYTTLRSEADILKSKLLDARKKRDITIHERDIAKRRIFRLENELNEIRRSRIWKIHKATVASLYRLNAFLPTKSGRLQRQRLATINASQHFDRNWYLERYSDVSEKNIDPAEHYIRFGADELRDPGPTFSTRFYVERYPDISKTGINALYHYERYGKKEQRKIAPAESAIGSDHPAVPLEPFVNPVSANKTPTGNDPSRSIQILGTIHQPTSKQARPAQNRFRWLTQEDLSGLSGESMIELGSARLARSPRQNGADGAAPSEALISMQVFAMLTDMPDIHALRLNQGDRAAPSPDRVMELTKCNIHSFLAVPIALDAIWYANARDLRIRFNAAGLADTQNVVVRGYQYDPAEDRGLVLVGEHALKHEIVQIADFALLNPYLPVLLTLTTPEAHLLDAAVLPFPSLCPGGTHETERFAARPSTPNDLTTIARELLLEHLNACEQGIGWALSRLLIDIRTATGAERIFSADIKEWLWSVFALQLESWHMPPLDADASAYWSEVFTAPQSMQNQARLQRRCARAQSGQKMVCPANALPSIHALATSRAEGGLQRICAPGAYVMTQSGNANIRWLVDVPPLARTPERALMLSGNVRHPFVDQADAMSDSWRVGAPIAILERDMRPRHVSQMIMPIAPEISLPLIIGNRPEQANKVSIVITAGNIGDNVIAAMLESIQMQRGVDVTEVIVATPPRSESSDDSEFAALLQRFFPQRHVLVECPAGEEYADRAHRAASIASVVSANLLFINSPLVLHDPRTLDTLVQLVSMDHVATASCMQIGADPSASPGHPVHALFSGIFPVRKSGVAETDCDEFDAQAMFPLDVYPVASVGDALFLIRADIWRSSGGFQSVQSKDHHAAVELPLKLSDSGMTHLLTTLVSAELHDPQHSSKHYSMKTAGHCSTSLRNTSICFEVLPA